MHRIGPGARTRASTGGRRAESSGQMRTFTADGAAASCYGLLASQKASAQPLIRRLVVYQSAQAASGGLLQHVVLHVGTRRAATCR